MPVVGRRRSVRGGEQHHPPGGDAGPGDRRERTPGAARGALTEHQHGDRGRGDRVGEGDRGQRCTQPRAAVGDLGQQQPRRGHPGQRHQQAGGQRGRVGLHGQPGHQLGERGGDREGESGRGRDQQAAGQGRPERPGGERQADHQRGRDGGHRPALTGPQLLLARGGHGQCQQEGEPGHGRTGAGPLPGGGSPAGRRRADRQREDESQDAQRLHDGQRPVGQRRHVQRASAGVQRHRTPPAGPAEDGREVAATGVRGRAGLGGEPFLQHRRGRVRRRRGHRQDDRHDECGHGLIRSR